MVDGHGSAGPGRASREGDETTVLVVDDDEAVRESFAVYLEPLGYVVRTTADAETGLSNVEDADIVLLDRQLPSWSGDEVLAEIRSRNVDCRVALATAVDPDFDIVQIDCDDYLAKPVDRADLVETVERLALLASTTRPSAI